MIIRKAILEDAAAIVNVHVKTWKISYLGFVPDEILQERQVTPERIEFIRKPIAQGLVWVAEVNGEIIGFAGLSEKSALPEAELVVFYVLPQYQGQGIGRALFSQVYKELIVQGYESLMLWTLYEGPSLEFYKKIGGRLSGKVKDWKYGLKVTEFTWKVR